MEKPVKEKLQKLSNNVLWNVEQSSKTALSGILKEVEHFTIDLMSHFFNKSRENTSKKIDNIGVKNENKII